MDNQSFGSSIFTNIGPSVIIQDRNATAIQFLNNNTFNDSLSANTTVVEKTGSTPLELFLLSFIIPSISLLLSLDSCIGFRHAAVLSFIALMEFTVLSDHIHLILTVLCCLLFARMYLISKFKWRIDKEMTDHQAKSSILDIVVSCKENQIPFLTDYRGHLLLATAISILAVDFNVFPSRFSKTTSFGWSVMDAGVGCFVAVHGMCSHQARGKGISLRRSLSSATPLLFLGFFRLILVTVVSYHRSISEYGVHWNFFFTLAITKMTCSLLFKLFPLVNSGLLALGLVTCHQWLLSSCVSDFILNERRIGLFEENKEGICSLPGFVVIYLQGVEIGKLFWKPRCKMRDFMQLLMQLVIIGSFGWIIMLVLHHNVQHTSRRMANFPYCVWVIALTSLQIAMHLLEHLILCLFQHKNNFAKTGEKQLLVTPHSSLLWHAINYNGLFYFLLANVLTGIVNLSINTDKASTLESLVILGAYASMLLATVILLMKFAIRVKFW